MPFTVQQTNQVLGRWSERTNLWSGANDNTYWLRARPKNGNATCPILRLPGTDHFSSQPDGLYIFIVPEKFIDAICIEVCNSLPNLGDKRSRYHPPTQSQLIECQLRWLEEEIDVQRGGRQPRWQAARVFPDTPPQSDLLLPVRHLRVLFALPPEQYENARDSGIAESHEFFCRQSSLRTFNAQPFRRFLKRLSLDTHFRTYND